MTETLDPNWHRGVVIRIDARDKTLIERASGLIAAGRAVVVKDLAVGQRNQAEALVGLAIAEAHAEAELEESMAKHSADKAEEARRRSKPARPAAPKTAQQLLEEWDRTGWPRPTYSLVPQTPSATVPTGKRETATAEELSDPPKEVKRTDVFAIGYWQASIADGRTKVV
jgi:hypothetical protein